MKRKAKVLQEAEVSRKPEEEEKNIGQIEDSESDDSDDEIIKARIGKIPYKWYENYKHIGYDSKLKKVEKTKQDDKIESLIKKTENPNWWKQIRDELNQQNITLTDKQLNLIDRIRQGKFASKKISENDYSVEFEYNDPCPLEQGYQPKRRFMPSKWERIMVNKIVQGIKLGRIKVGEKPKQQEEQLFDIWDQPQDQDQIMRKLPPAIAPPKLQLPGHSESYNPPEEYLFTEKEKQDWLNTDPEDREKNFLPKKYENLRNIQFYDKLINERFERCLDLYLCPRVRKRKLDIDPDSLIPKIPNNEELRPFPSQINIQYIGHKSRIRSICVNSNGQFLVSCDEKGYLYIWETTTSRKILSQKLEGFNYNVQFNKDGLLALANQHGIYIYNIKKILNSNTYESNQEILQQCQENHEKDYNKLLNWEFPKKDSQQYLDGLRIIIRTNFPTKFLNFHKNGDYLASVSPMAQKKNEEVHIHSISKGQSQRPFNRTKGNVEKVVFHNSKPVLFVMTKRNIHIYNLQKQANVKKLISGSNWNSCLDIHPYGDNLIVGSFGKKVVWFDLELQNTPYKNLKYHDKAVRQVIFHRKYPLFASSSDDGTINIMHGKVFKDSLQNALIVPLKVLKGHEVKNDLGVLDIVFHPTQPWIFSCGADHRIFLWT